MEEQYKAYIIRVTTEHQNRFPWKPICRILDGASREFIKQIDWQLVTTHPIEPKRQD